MCLSRWDGRRSPYDVLSCEVICVSHHRRHFGLRTTRIFVSDSKQSGMLHNHMHSWDGFTWAFIGPDFRSILHWLTRMVKMRINRYQRAVLPGAVVALVLISTGRLSSVSLHSLPLQFNFGVYQWISPFLFIIFDVIMILAASRSFSTSICPSSLILQSC